MSILLKDILSKTNTISIQGNTEIDINNLVFDSRIVKTNDAFFAIKGFNIDGHQFINEAIEIGAKAIICEELPKDINSDICYIQVNDTAEALGIAASNYYGNPTSKIKLIGITGTNGKTTTAALLYQLVRKLGYKAGLLSTVNNYIEGKEIKATHTTPDVLKINELLNEMTLVGCEFCFMEVSSHAVHQKRIAGLNFEGALFTNITHDHLDYHKTFSEYIKAKKTFFDNLSKDAFAITNADDKNGLVMLQNSNAKKKTFALKRPADFNCKVIESGFEGMMLNIDENELWTPFIGSFNAYNLTGVYSTAICLGFEKQEVLTTISSLQPVVGRFDNLKSKDNITGIIDYAHTPDALINVIKTINDIREPGQNLITVVGAGGNRDTSKRPIMADIAASNSDKVILTADNPRDEKPEDIIDEMKKGVSVVDKRKLLSITDRKEAIKTAAMLAYPGDIILVAGKGHETYQEINGERKHFDDKEELLKIFKERE